MEIALCLVRTGYLCTEYSSVCTDCLMRATGICSNARCGADGFGRSCLATKMEVKQDAELLVLEVLLPHLCLVVDELILISQRTEFELCKGLQSC